MQLEHRFHICGSVPLDEEPVNTMQSPLRSTMSGRIPRSPPSSQPALVVVRSKSWDLPGKSVRRQKRRQNPGTPAWRKAHVYFFYTSVSSTSLLPKRRYRSDFRDIPLYPQVYADVCPIKSERGLPCDCHTRGDRALRIFTCRDPLLLKPYIYH